ncbi:MAG: ATP-binding protein [Gordonibacter sp.]
MGISYDATKKNPFEGDIVSIEKFDINEFVNLARKIDSDTADVEVKTAARGLSKDVVETLSAFANRSGGTVVCGLSEKDGLAPAVDFNAKKISEALLQACADKMEPPIRASVRIEEFEGALVVVAGIPETEPYQKPCYVKARGPYDGSFVRAGEGDRRLSRYEVDRLIEERQQPRYDARVIEEAETSELDPELVDGFLKRERAASPRVFAGLSDDDALLTMGVTGKGKNSESKPTLAGLMALGRHPQKHFPRGNVTFAVFPGTSKEELAKDGARFLDSRTVIGPVPVMVAETLAAVRRNMRVASYVEGGSRRDVSEYPEVAIREAVANALMHRDYSPEGLASQVQVNMFADRIEVVNPGGLYGTVTVDNIGTYGASSSRNQYLSRILESTPYPEGYPEKGFVVENKGTGFAQIQAALRGQGMDPAEPEDSLSLFVVTMKKKQVLATGSVLASASITLENKMGKDLESLLSVVRSKGSISTSEASLVLGVSTATAYRRIKELVDKGLLVSADKQGRAVRYKLI